MPLVPITNGLDFVSILGSKLRDTCVVFRIVGWIVEGCPSKGGVLGVDMVEDLLRM